MGLARRVTPVPIEFPADSPHDPDLTKLVEDLARDTYTITTPTLKLFSYIKEDDDQDADGDLVIFREDTVEQDTPFVDWFEDYYQGHRTVWENSHVVVYSDVIEGLDQVRYHVVVGDDFPVYALCVNRKTGQAQWYLQETPAAELLASKKR